MYQKKSINMHPFFPPEISDIVLHYLLEINPFLSAKISKYWYYKAMPIIWDEIDLNMCSKGIRSSSAMDFYRKQRAYCFYNIFAQPDRAKIKNANCLKFITKLKPFNKFHPGTIVNIVKKCPNLKEVNFLEFNSNNIPYHAIAKFARLNRNNILVWIGSIKQHALPKNHVEGISISRG